MTGRVSGCGFDTFTSMVPTVYLRHARNAEIYLCLGFDVLKVLWRLFLMLGFQQEPPVTESKDAIAALLCQ